MIGIGGIDTRALTTRIRDGGAPNGHLSFPAQGKFDLPRLSRAAGPGRDWRGWTSRRRSPARNPTMGRDAWAWPTGTGDRPSRVTMSWRSTTAKSGTSCAASGRRLQGDGGAGDRDRRGHLRHDPDGVFLSNGPGDPAATGDYAVPAIQGVLASRQAAVRHLSGPPIARPRPRRPRPTRWCAAIAAPTSR